MSDVLQTNIFFFITAVAAICIAAVLMWMLYRLARFLKALERVSQILEEELYVLRDDVADARSFIRNEGIKLKHMLGFVSVLFTLGEKMKGRVHKPRGREKQNNTEKHNDHE